MKLGHKVREEHTLRALQSGLLAKIIGLSNGRVGKISKVELCDLYSLTKNSWGDHIEEDEMDGK
jgi:hypothetical protein